MADTPAVSEKLVRFVASKEGFRANPYWDISRWSHGYGTEAASGTAPAITEAEARVELRRELQKIVPFIPRLKRLKQQEIDALASFGYNLGPQALTDPDYSTLAARMKSREGREFSDRRDIYHDELRKWFMPGSEFEQGLLKRRMEETRMARNGEYPSD
jgi:GH24 family phage-related lysozyme (muramidase)